MSDIMGHMAYKARVFDSVYSLEGKEREQAIEELKAETEKASPYKKGQLVVLCRSPGFTLTNGIEALPHDHNDPNQHSESRVLDYTIYGTLQVAVNYGNNPHCGECGWMPENIRPSVRPDWKPNSRFKPGMDLTFTWERSDFDHRKPGDIARAHIVEAHIMEGEWFVEYEKPCGMWITRVVHERLFIAEY